MNRTGLLIALTVAAIVGVVFGLYPDLDIWVSAHFFQPGRGWSVAPGAQSWRNVASGLITLIAAPALIALALKLVRPRRPMLLPGRALVLMISTLVLVPGLVANVLLKDNWGRPRPAYVTAFDGTDPFLAWWDPRGPCEKNCSFVAGEPSGAFWTLAPAALTPPSWRVAAYAAALSFGAAVGVLRIAAGGHFFTDVVFAGVFAFLLIWLVHGLLYRWRATRIEDADVERWLVRVTRSVLNVVTRLAARVRGVTPPR